MIKMNRIQRIFNNIIYILLFGVYFIFLSKLNFSISKLGEIRWNEMKLIEMSMIRFYVLQILCNTSLLLFAWLYLIIPHNFVDSLICVTKSCCLAFSSCFLNFKFDNWRRVDSNPRMSLLEALSIHRD